MKLKNVIGAVNALVGTTIGFLLALPYGARDWKLRSEGGTTALTAHVKRAIGNPGAQTWGTLIFHTDPVLSDRLLAHEMEHVRQGQRWGVLFLLAYGAEFLGRYVWYLIRDGETDWFHAYYDISWEVKARAHEK